MKKATGMDWFRHDINAMNDLHMRKLIRRLGLRGIGAFWCAVEILYQSGNSVSKEDLLEEIGLNDENAAECYETLLSIGLVQEEDGIVHSKRVQDEIDLALANMEKKAYAGRKGMESRWGKRGQAEPEITPDNNVITKDNNVITDYNNVIKNDNGVITDDNRPITADNTLHNITKQNNIVLSQDSLHSSFDNTRQQKSADTPSKDDFCLENGEEERTEGRGDSKKAKDLLDKFKALCPSLPQPRAMSSGREKAISAILKAYTMEQVEEVFRKAEASDFLSGRDGKWTNCGLDWLLNARNFCKVLEGNYDKTADGSSTTSQQPKRWMSTDDKDVWAKYENPDGSVKLPENW